MCSKPSTSRSNGQSSCTGLSTPLTVGPGQYDMYQYMYNSPKRPDTLCQQIFHSAETVLIYAWVLIQTLFLIAGLAVLHFSTFSVMICYLVNGVAKGRREFLPQK